MSYILKTAIIMPLAIIVLIMVVIVFPCFVKAIFLNVKRRKYKKCMGALYMSWCVLCVSVFIALMCLCVWGESNELFGGSDGEYYLGGAVEGIRVGKITYNLFYYTMIMSSVTVGTIPFVYLYYYLRNFRNADNLDKFSNEEKSKMSG